MISIDRLLNLVITGLHIYQLLIIGYIVISFINALSGKTREDNILNPIVEPYLQVYRNFIPVVAGFDFSALIGYYMLDFMKIGIGNLIA